MNLGQRLRARFAQQPFRRQAVGRDSSAWLICLCLWLAMLCCLTSAHAQETQPTVLVVRPKQRSAILDEAQVRLIAELRDADFAARPIAREQLKQRDSSKPHSGKPLPEPNMGSTPFAVIAFTTTRTGPRVEVWLTDSIDNSRAPHYVALEKDARTLAIRAVELLRASLLDATASAETRARLAPSVLRWLDLPADDSSPAAKPVPKSKLTTQPAKEAHSAKLGKTTPNPSTLNIIEPNAGAKPPPRYTLIGPEPRPQKRKQDDNTARPLIAAGTGALMPTGGWPAAWVLTARTSFPIYGGWSIGLAVALAPRPNQLTGLDGEARLSRQLYSVVADYTFAAPDAWVVPRLALDLGALHASTRGLVNADSREQWAFTTGAHAGLAFHLTTGFALYTDAGLLLTIPRLSVPVGSRDIGDNGVVSGLLEAGAAARF